MQYVSFLKDKMVSVVDVQLTEVDGSRTDVEVRYARTALDAAVNHELEAMGRKDRESGPEWQQAIAKCLGSSGLVDKNRY